MKKTLYTHTTNNTGTTIRKAKSGFLRTYVQPGLAADKTRATWRPLFPAAFRDGVHPSTPLTAIGSVSSLSVHYAIVAYRWRSLPRADIVLKAVGVTGAAFLFSPAIPSSPE